MKRCMTILLAAIAILANGAFADVTIADFEASGAVDASANVIAQRIDSSSPQGRWHLQLTMKPDGLMAESVRLPQMSENQFVGQDRLLAQVRVQGTNEVTVLRWLAIDGTGKPIFQRRFELKPGETWVQIDEPLRAWRWHEAHPGKWAEVRQIGLRIETPAATVELDDIRLTGVATPQERTRWLVKLAFQDRSSRSSEGEGMLVGTDAVDAFTHADLHMLIQDMVNVRAWVRRTFADVIRPIDGEGPIALFIFAADAQREAFFLRLGQQWRATLVPPRAQGFTVQDICSSTFSPEQGVRRPVYLHEAVHGVVARDLRLPSGYAPHSPLQEGLANYLQLCVHPKSIQRSTFITNFAKPIDPAGKGFFIPLQMLFERRATTQEYAQLASVVAYLVERDVPLLQDLAKGMADGDRPTDILARRKTDWRTVERRWLEWGRQRFPDQTANQTQIFDLPPEFK